MCVIPTSPRNRQTYARGDDSSDVGGTPVSTLWRHDQQDGNGDAHLKAGLVGPSETIPIIDGQLGLSRWQNIFFCEFDGPRPDRRIVCTVLADAQG